MVRKSFTAVLERNSTFGADFATEPYEAGWAGEALWFVRVLDVSGEGVVLNVRPQISPDGLFWCDEGTEPTGIREASLYSGKLRHFGQWLRLQCELRGTDPMVKVLIYLALKE